MKRRSFITSVLAIGSAIIGFTSKRLFGYGLPIKGPIPNKMVVGPSYDITLYNPIETISNAKLIRAIERNIVVYDRDASEGVLTQRLTELMQEICKQEFRHSDATQYSLGKITRFIVDSPIVGAVNNSSLSKENQYRIANNTNYPLVYTTIQEITKRYLSYGCCLAGKDKHLIIGVTDTGEYMLGSF